MRYPISPRGASFSATEIPLLVGKNQARPVGVTVDSVGRIYVTIAYMAHNDGSPIYASDLVQTPRGTFAAARTSNCCAVATRPSSLRSRASPQLGTTIRRFMN
jgi:hypothetical protein